MEPKETLYGAVQPLVLTIEEYQSIYGEDDPEELALMQLQDKELASQITGALKDLYWAETEFAHPRQGEGLSLEIGAVTDLHELREIAAAMHEKTVDDYHEGRVPAGFPFNHLINHSDTDGYYFPIEFPQAFFLEEISIGSAINLLEELDALEPALAARYPTELMQAITLSHAEGDEDEPGVDLSGPVGVWHALRRLCRSAIEQNMPIHFG